METHDSLARLVADGGSVAVDGLVLRSSHHLEPGTVIVMRADGAAPCMRESLATDAAALDRGIHDIARLLGEEPIQ